MRRRIRIPKTLKWTWLMILHVVFIAGLILLFHAGWHLRRPVSELPPGYKAELARLALNSLESRDVPVASLLIYRGKIIGRGYNTVVRNRHAGEHAEINAISEALDSLGFRQFQTLDRDSLWLITTFEPCLMCAGALAIYNIQKVYFLKEKPLSDNLRQDARLLRYFWKREALQPAALQDSLFYLHPDYPEHLKKPKTP